MLSRFVLGTALLVGSLGISEAATISYDLTCVLNGLDSHACVAGPSFGTVTLTDTGANQVGLSVNLGNAGLKFRDLMLNFTGVGFTDITSSDGQNLILSPNSFSINPYSGAFDVGTNGAQGWTGDSPYSVTLSGVGGVLTASLFNSLDSGGKLDVALHIQSIGPGGCSGADNGTTTCTPGALGQGSLKIGGVSGTPVLQDGSVPEPGSLALMSAGLLGVALLRRRLTHSR